MFQQQEATHIFSLLDILSWWYLRGFVLICLVFLLEPIKIVIKIFYILLFFSWEAQRIYKVKFIHTTFIEAEKMKETDLSY